MKLDHLNHIGVAAPLAILAVMTLLGCSKPAQPVDQILQSKMSDEQLLDAFGDRTRALTKTPDAFDAEMKRAGFVFKPQGEKCGQWELPVKPAAESAQDKAVRAFVQVCKTDRGGLDIGRSGIRRGAMTYD